MHLMRGNISASTPPPLSAAARPSLPPPEPILLILSSSPVHCTPQMPSWLDNPIFTLAAAAAFGLIAYDVNAPDSVHLLQPIDQGIHHWVGAHTSAGKSKAPETRA